MTSYTSIRILLADDHELFRDGFSVLIKKQPEIELIAEAADGVELLSMVKEYNPDVIITDIKMPRLDGIEATKRLTSEFPYIGVIALSMFDEENLIVQMLEAGAKGYLLKNAQKTEIIDAIKAVNKDQTYYCNQTSYRLAEMIAKSSYNPYRKIKKPTFSEREREVIEHICKQESNKEIASQLNLSVRTVESYRQNIMEKMMVKGTAGIVIYAIKYNLYKL